VTVITVPDRRDGVVYITSEQLDLAVEVALATGRPLLLRGEPGSGKSSLAAYVARERNWRYYEYVVTGQTKATDLLWTFDHVRRLSDAQLRRGKAVLNDDLYITPGPLWWAMNPDSARGSAAAGAAGRSAVAMQRPEPFAETNAKRHRDHAVVLIDEIDKADPDVPNSLLVPLGSHRFTVRETGLDVAKAPRWSAESPAEKGPGRHTSAGSDAAPQSAASHHLIVITTNEERELPQAFLRRCVVMVLDKPGADKLARIARAHITDRFHAFSPADEHLAAELAALLEAARMEAQEKAMRPPSTAEYLDALIACKELGITPLDPRWEQLRGMVLLKPQQPGF
jgi:MoxR-like ATPase